jgi:Type II secretion system protein C
MLSGAALAGWLAGSTLSPPVAVTQVVAPRPVAPPSVRTELPRVNWPVVVTRVGAPAPSRNPFTFRESERHLDERPPAPVPAVGDDVAGVADDARTAAAPEPAPRWRLSGIATNEDGDVVAVISGSGDVFLMRAGDELPGGDAVTEVGATHVVVRTAAGPLTLRLP